MRLCGRAARVTGSVPGIGLAIAAWMVGDGASHLTGQTIGVDGRWTTCHPPIQGTDDPGPWASYA
jgi:hypothetical protein